MRALVRSFALLAAVTLAGTVLSAATGTAPAAARTVRTATTSAAEKARVDRVPTPKLDWYSCYGGYRCTTVRLPLDYDDPTGATVELALLKVPAAKPKQKLGTLFVNPGGPGGSGTEFAYYADGFLSSDLLDRFDVVGMDPRGVAFSDNVQCFATNAGNEAVLDVVRSTPFPDTAAEYKAFVKAHNAHAKACSTTGRPMSAAISTANVARDLDVLRRAVGDKKLNFLGFSYGSYLGQVYANLFPDRVRAVAIDGVLDPRAWAGSAGDATAMGDRLKAADGAAKALREILVRCDRAGGEGCSFAVGDPVANWQLIGERLKAKPLDLGFEYGYAEFAGDAMSALYYEDGYDLIATMGTELLLLTEPPERRARTTAAAAARLRSAKAAVREVRTELGERARRSPLPSSPIGRSAFGFPYDNSFDTFQTIACTDSVNAATLAAFPDLSAAADRRAPGFGPLWLWNLASCASASWTVADEDAYTGPWTRRTGAPVLIVGNYWDPATNFAGAVAAAKLLPNSRLLRSDSWGHTAYGSSDCVDDAVSRYLIKGTVPKRSKVCTGYTQPFDGDGEFEDVSVQRRLNGSLLPRR